MAVAMKKNTAGLTDVSRQSFTRIYFIHRWIAAGRYPNVSYIAGRLEVSPRTIERDIQILRDILGAPITYDTWHKGYRYEGSFSLPPMQLTEGELLTLYLGQRLLAQFGGTPFGQIVQGALAKLKLMLPEHLTVDIAILDQGISFDVEPLRGDAELLAQICGDILSAIREYRSLKITYYTASRDAVSDRLVDPYHLHFYNGAWYLIAYCHSRCEVRLFAVDRIRQWQVTDNAFVISPDFSLETYLENSLGIERGPKVYEVAIRFQPEQARWIKERLWHPGQMLEELADGALVLKMQLSGLQEARRWVLSFGCHAEVLSPPELRQEMAREARALAAIYNSD